MPKYDYKCPECTNVEEVERSIKAEEVKPRCADCNINMERVYNNFGIQFKGSGFYKTDHGSK
jgi:putative FmdB family regulatory protein